MKLNHFKSPSKLMSTSEPHPLQAVGVAVTLSRRISSHNTKAEYFINDPSEVSIDSIKFISL
jgi:hypothetical protein